MSHHRTIVALCLIALLGACSLDWDATWAPRQDSGRDGLRRDKTVKLPDGPGKDRSPVVDRGPDQRPAGPATLTTDWVRGLGSSVGAVGFSVTSDSAKKLIFVGGSYTGRVPPTTGKAADGEGTVVASWRSTKVQHWVTVGDGTKVDRVRAVAMGKANDLYVCGTLSGKDYNLGSPVKTFGNNDILIARLNPDKGTVDWQVTAGSKGSDQARGLTLSDDGKTLYVTGWYSNSANFPGYSAGLTTVGKTDIFLAALNTADGKILWVASAGGSDIDAPEDLALDGSGKLVLVGYYTTKAHFGKLPLSGVGRQIFITRFNPNSKPGAFTWAGGPQTTISANEAQAVAVDRKDGAVFTVGFFRGVATFDKHTITAKAGEVHGFVAKQDSKGAFSWVKHANSTSGAGMYDVALDRQGHVWVNGRFDTSTQFDGRTYKAPKGGVGALVAQLDSKTGAVRAVATAFGEHSNSWVDSYGLAVNDDAVMVTGSLGVRATTAVTPGTVTKGIFGASSLSTIAGARGILYLWRLNMP